MFDKAAFILTMFFVAMFLGISDRGIEIESDDQQELFLESAPRRSITFLMGTDKEDQQYFSLAEAHFLFDEVEKTDAVVKSCRDLTALLEYLNKESESSPWGIVNIVVHGNMWGGLSVPMWPDGERAFPKELFGAAINGAFPLLDTAAIDARTQVNVWACGIGNNPLIKLGLENIFTNAVGISAQVQASPDFVIFHRVAGRIAPVRLKASYWPYFFKRGYRPGSNEIAAALAQQFPDDTISWGAALERDQISANYEVFKDEFNLPVVWTVFYDEKEDRPNVGSFEEKMAWIKSQPELMEKIDAFEIPLGKYHWTVDKILKTLPDGTKRPAIKAIGMCTVLCVVAPQVDDPIATKEITYGN